MLGFVKGWIGPKANPIGVDFGTDTLKLAQVAHHNGAWHLVAAASADVPAHVKGNQELRMEFLTDTMRDLLGQNRFVGRQAVLALPAAAMCIQHLRLPKMDEESLKKALPWEARGKLPIDPGTALLRHHVAGEIYQDQEVRSEVIVMAAKRDLVNQFLAAASKAKLDVMGMNVEPKAVLDCFTHVYRRKADAENVTCYVDLGCTGTRAFIAFGGNIRFARTIPVGGEHLNAQVAAALDVNLEEARLVRLKLAEAQVHTPAPAGEPARPERREAGSEQGSFAILGAALAAAEKQQPPQPARKPQQASDPQSDEASLVEQACRGSLNKIVDELDLCRRYYESTFPSKPLDRLVFVGGEARHRSLCQYIACELGIAAQVGDPLVRIARDVELPVDSGIDRRAPQPNWAVAIGLSLGEAEAAVKKKSA